MAFGSMKVDVIKGKISDDGKILRTETDPISGANHAGFERVLEGLQAAMGGQTKITRKGHGHAHAETGHKVEQR